VFVASTHAHEVAVSRLQALNVVANGVLVLDHVTTHHPAEVVEIAPLHCKQRTPYANQYKFQDICITLSRTTDHKRQNYIITTADCLSN